MVDAQSLLVRFDRLQEYVKILKELRTHNRTIVIKDYPSHGLTERDLQLAIECLLDIGSLIIVQYGMRKPSTKQEIIEILEEEKVLPSDFTHRLAGIAGFRNILVHDYVKIDRVRVYNYLQKNLPEFDVYLRHVKRFIQKHDK